MTDTPTSNTSTLWQEHNTQDRVVVAQAENEFGRLQRSLSTPKAPNKIVSSDPDSLDLEKGRDGDRQETFDLREYLTSSNDANSAAGIKHKHVGVTWEDLEVSGIGGEQNKVRNFIRHPRIFVSRFVFIRSTSLLMQVKDLVHFLYGFLLTFWPDAITELVTFPFVVLRGVLQPILPTRLLKPPPVRKIIHKWVSRVRDIFLSS